MKTTLRLVALVCSLVITASAQAQEPGKSNVYYGTADQNFGGIPYHYPDYGYGYHSSTAGEGYLRGYGAAIRGLGEFRVLNSISKRHDEEAKSRRLDNELKYAETYFAKRRLNAEQVRELYGPRPTAAQVAAYSAARQPERLTAAQVSLTGGTIFWPAALEGAAFEEWRLIIEDLFMARQNGHVTAGNSQEIQEVAAAMQSQLKEQIGEHSPMQYVEAKQFLDSVAYESRFSTPPAGLASR